MSSLPQTRVFGDISAPEDAKWEATRSRTRRSVIFNGTVVELIGL